VVTIEKENQRHEHSMISFFREALRERKEEERHTPPRCNAPEANLSTTPYLNNSQQNTLLTFPYSMHSSLAFEQTQMITSCREPTGKSEEPFLG